ncbi:MAG: histidine phosphatase family protein [Ktedonobacterales bacterium]|nr:histidine phosphatase family protein [Ktedonobacterales bacterium]
MTDSPQDDFAHQLLTDDADPFLSLKRGGTEVYLIRHADALPGMEEVVAGGYDEQDLSELGRRQAQALAERLRASSLTAIYTSPIGRALQTAIPTARALNIEVQVDVALREIALGPIGPTAFPSATPRALAEALRTRLRDIAVIALESGRWSSIPGTEPSAALRARITAAVAQIAAAHPGQRVAVVSHGGAINAYFAALLGIERDYFFPAANTSISIVRVKGPRRLLLALNDIAHLRQAGLFTSGG